MKGVRHAKPLVASAASLPPVAGSAVGIATGAADEGDVNDRRLLRQ